MLAVGHDCQKVNLQLENKAGPQKILEEVQKVLKKINASASAAAPLSTGDQRKIAFQASCCSGSTGGACVLGGGYNGRAVETVGLVSRVCVF